MWFKRDDAVKAAEAQRKIDDLAKRDVEGMLRVISEEEKVTPHPHSEFAKAHAAFYDGTEHELAALGFRAVGDFEPSGQDAKPPADRTVYRFALSGDGHVAASWFVIAGQKPVSLLFLTTFLQDGRECETGRGGSNAAIPQPPEMVARKLPESTPTEAMVRDHLDFVAGMGGSPRCFATADELIAARSADWRRVWEFRKSKGPALFEPYLRSMLGDRYEELGAPRLVESIMNHPEWWAGATPEAVGGTGSPGGGPAAGAGSPEAATAGGTSPAGVERPVSVMYLTSRDEQSGRGLLTTLGMFMHGLAELQIREIAGNHWRAATFLAQTVARKLVEHVRRTPAVIPAAEWRSGIELSLSRADVTRDQLMIVRGRFPELEGEDAGPVNVLVRLETLGEKGDPDTELLRILPPAGHTGDWDEWLRRTCRALGQDAPVAQPFGALDTVMRAASELSRARLPGIRAAFRAGEPAGHGVLVKTGLVTTRGAREYVWIRVAEWPEGSVKGTLISKPADCPEYTLGQQMSVAEKDVFDLSVISATDEVLEPAMTDVVALEFGVNLQ